MPGGREISGADVLAAARSLPGARVDEEALRALVDPADRFPSYDALARACPPERVGLTSGAHAALFAPLFGEFE